MVNCVKCRTEIQEDEKCDVLSVHVEEDVIGMEQSQCCDVYNKQIASWGEIMGIKITDNLMGNCFFNNFQRIVPRLLVQRK